MKNFILAVSMFCGTVIGVGMFGLPYVAAKVGFMPVLIYFGVIGLVMMVIQLMYGEICLRTREEHRLPGYVEIYLGKKYKFLPILSNSVGLYGANLAYILVGGTFLANLLIPIFGGGLFTYHMIFFAVGALLIYSGSGTIAKSEFVSMAVFFLVLLFLAVKSLPQIDIYNLLESDLSFKNLILPYGVILFSLSGMSVIPETREILKTKFERLKNVIILGTLIPIITYLIFIITVLGVTGANTSTDALSGLVPFFDKKFLAAGFISGIIATFTSYLTIGTTIKKILWYDLKLSHLISSGLAIFVPLALYLLGLQNFLTIVAFTGAVTMGIDVVLIALVYLKAQKLGDRKPEYQALVPKTALYFLIGLFLIGVVLNLFPL
ncbi:MAG: hypothetical protein HUU49_01795 [Candidatus Buchananbacteria bacterium]|nr:hypothetical protein [Candidatus Buchananbacteria bacterium]